MTALQRTLVWLAGHQPRLLHQDHPDDLLGLAKIGSVVLLASLVAGVCWATAAYQLAAGAPLWGLVAAVIVGGAVGLAVVLMLDRYFIYMSDARRHGRLTRAFYLLARGVVLFITSSLTAQGLMPLLLHNELKAHALTMTEAAEQTRHDRLSARLDVAGKAALQQEAASSAERAAMALKQMPPEVMKLEAEVRRCRQQLAVLRQARPDAADALEAWSHQIASWSAQCQLRAEAEQRARAAHMLAARRALQDAERQLTDAREAHASAEREVRERVEAARAVEVQALTPASATVMADLLKADPGARIKAWLLTALLMTLETMPIWLKSIAGRSGVGERLCAEDDQRRWAIQERLQRARLDAEIAEQVHFAAREATLKALQAPTVQAQFSQSFQQQLVALAPIEASAALMAELVRSQHGLDQQVQRHPSLASVMTASWMAAVKSSAEALRRAAGDAAVSPVAAG